MKLFNLIYFEHTGFWGVDDMNLNEYLEGIYNIKSIIFLSEKDCSNFIQKKIKTYLENDLNEYLSLKKIYNTLVELSYLDNKCYQEMYYNFNDRWGDFFKIDYKNKCIKRIKNIDIFNYQSNPYDTPFYINIDITNNFSISFDIRESNI